MFEDATFDSSSVLPSQISKWLLFGLAVNLLVVAAVIAIPLIFPDMLQSQLLQQQLYVPAAQGHPAQQSTQTTTATAQPTPRAVPINLNPGSRLTPSGSATGVDSEPGEQAGSLGTMDPGTDGVIGGRSVFHQSTPTVTLKTAAPRVTTLSSGVTDGMAIVKTPPAYPAMARITGTSGTVVLAATISPSGSIDNLRVISGNQMLRQAALDAVKTWRYRPYLLNGQPVEVETTINVVFSMGGR